MVSAVTLQIMLRIVDVIFQTPKAIHSTIDRQLNPILVPLEPNVPRKKLKVSNALDSLSMTHLLITLTMLLTSIAIVASTASPLTKEEKVL